MASFEKNLLIGYGERLTVDIAPPRRRNNKTSAYTVQEAEARLAPQMRQSIVEFDSRREGSLPRNYAVAAFTIHPEWIAKSYFPNELLSGAGLVSIGSAPTLITPDKWTKLRAPEPTATTTLFVSAPLPALRDFAAKLEEGSDDEELAQLVRIEEIRAVSPGSKIRSASEDAHVHEGFFEVALHSLLNDESDFVVRDFVSFAESLEIEVPVEKRIEAGDLTFLPVQASNAQMRLLTEYSFLRVARPLVSLRPTYATLRAVRPAGSVAAFDERPLDDSFRVAVLDGGFSDNSHDLVRVQELPGLGAPAPDGVEHGGWVTSAALYGSVDPGQKRPVPFSGIDHFRVLDVDSENDPYNLFDVLGRIETIVGMQRHSLINLSLGPDVQCEDGDVHAWTSKLDELLSDGRVLMTVAAGNNGELDRSSGNARILVPADAANAMSVGAATSLSDVWDRAPYSAIGPGRSPATIKPDVLAFGGDGAGEEFGIVEPDGTFGYVSGTSFAAPSTIRLAAGLKAFFGDSLTPLTIRTLLTHSAANPLKLSPIDVGWGRLPADIEDIISFSDDEVRVVYQGTLRPGGWSRATLPLPASGLRGRIEIAATFGFLGPVDTADPSNYTRGGLEIVFRPDIARFSTETQQHPDTDVFFQKKDFATERQQRDDDLKWQPVLKKSRSFQSNKLNQPVFDIHYNARFRGGATTAAQNLAYSLCVTIRAREMPDLYAAVMRTFAGRLESLRIQSQVAARVRP